MDIVRNGALSITSLPSVRGRHVSATSRRGGRSRMRAVTEDPTTPPTEQDEPVDGADLTDEERRVLANVAGILRRIKFGTVVLVVQDGKVVQIEMAEKFRLR